MRHVVSKNALKSAVNCLGIAALGCTLTGALIAQQLIPPSDAQKKPRASNMTLVG